MKSILFVASILFAMILNVRVVHAQRFTSKGQTSPVRFDTAVINAEKSYLALKAGDLDNARKFLSLADASNPFSMYVRATLTQDAAQAAGVYRLIVNQYSDKPIAREALVQLYNYHYAAGDYRLARTDYLQLQKYPGKTQLVDPAGLSDKIPVVKDSLQPPVLSPGTSVETAPHISAQEEAPVDAGESFAVQLGVFSTRANAEKFVADMRTENINTRIVEKPVEGKTLFGVMTGEFRTREAAESFANGLKARSIKCLVVETGESRE